MPWPGFVNQVAGHQGLSHEGGAILVPEPGKIAKPVGRGYFAGEDQFYRAIGSYPALASFCPAYFGTRTFGGRDFVILEDITHGMKRPCVVDIKLGTCTVAPDAPWTKRITHLAKDRATTTRSLGLRLIGAQTATAAEDGAPVRLGKPWGKALRQQDMPDALRTCFSADGALCRAALLEFVPRLQQLARVLEDSPRWQLVSSSLLFAFEPPPPSAAPATPAAPAAEPRPGWHYMRVIDFAHAYPLRSARDSGYLYGLHNLIHLMRSLLHADTASPQAGVAAAKPVPTRAGGPPPEPPVAEAPLAEGSDGSPSEGIETGRPAPPRQRAESGEAGAGEAALFPTELQGAAGFDALLYDEEPIDLELTAGEVGHGRPGDDVSEVAEKHTAARCDSVAAGGHFRVLRFAANLSCDGGHLWQVPLKPDEFLEALSHTPLGRWICPWLGFYSTPPPGAANAAHAVSPPPAGAKCMATRRVSAGLARPRALTLVLSSGGAAASSRAGSTTLVHSGAALRGAALDRAIAEAAPRAEGTAEAPIDLARAVRELLAPEGPARAAVLLEEMLAQLRPMLDDLAAGSIFQFGTAALSLMFEAGAPGAADVAADAAGAAADAAGATAGERVAIRLSHLAALSMHRAPGVDERLLAELRSLHRAIEAARQPE